MPWGAQPMAPPPGAPVGLLPPGQQTQPDDGTDREQLAKTAEPEGLAGDDADRVEMDAAPAEVPAPAAETSGSVDAGSGRGELEDEHVGPATEEDEQELEDSEAESTIMSEHDTMQHLHGGLSNLADPQVVGGYLRHDLIKSHLRRPRVSVRKLTQYVRWLNSLHVWPSPVDISSLHEVMCNGLLLCALMKKLVPGTQYKGLNKRPLTRRPAIANLEQALSVIWRSGRVNNTRVPSADEIYNGKTDRIAVLVQEVFDVYVVRDMRKLAPTMMTWFAGVLSQYRRQLGPGCLRAPHDDAWAEFQTGTSMFCVLYHFCGPSWVGTGSTAVKVDSRKIYWEPRDLAQHRSNVQQVFKLLEALRIEVLWTVDDWITFPDSDFVLLQLRRIYERFQHSHCVIPPAQGFAVGMSSGENGEPIIVGLDWADKQPASASASASGAVAAGDDASYRAPAVFLGNGLGQSLAAPPIFDSSELHLSPGLFLSGAVYARSSPTTVLATGPSSPSLTLSPNATATRFAAMSNTRTAAAATASGGSPGGGGWDNSVLPGSTSRAERRQSTTTAHLRRHARGPQLGDDAELAARADLSSAQHEQVLTEKEHELNYRFAALQSQADVLPVQVREAYMLELEEQKLALARERELLATRRRDTPAIGGSNASSTAATAELDVAKSLDSRRPPTSPVGTSPRSRSGPANRSPASARGSPQVNHKKLERGWISQTRKMSSHNHVIAKTQTSRRVLATALNSPDSATRTRKRADLLDHHALSSGAALGDLDPDTAWEAFKMRLQGRQQAYLKQRNDAEDLYLEKLKQERFETAPKEAFAIPSPLGPNRGNGSGGTATSPGLRSPADSAGRGEDQPLSRSTSAMSFEDVKAAIRAEELQLMQDEEERRLLVMRHQRDVLAQQMLQKKEEQLKQREQRQQQREQEQRREQHQQYQQQQRKIHQQQSQLEEQQRRLQVQQAQLKEQQRQQNAQFLQQRLGQVPPGPAPAAASIDRRPPPLGAGSERALLFPGDAPVGQAPVLPTEDVSASLAWLSNTRRLTLQLRNSSRPFDFAVVPGRALSQDPERQASLAFAWTAPDDGSRLSGFVLLMDVDKIQRTRDPQTFTIELKPQRPLAVQSTGGLREVRVRTNSVPECDKYAIGLQSLLTS